MTMRSKALALALIAGGSILGLVLIGAVHLGWIGAGNGADRREGSASTDSETALLPVTSGAIPSDTGSDGKTAMSIEMCEGLGAKALKVVFADGDSFGDRVARVTDWRSFSTLEFTVFNPAATRTDLILTIKDRASKNVRTRVEKPISLPPGKTLVQLDLVGLKKEDGSVPDWANVTKWYLACKQGTAPTLYFGDFWLTTSGRLTVAAAAAAASKPRPAAEPAPKARSSPASSLGGTTTSKPMPAATSPNGSSVGQAASYRITGAIGGQPVDLVASPLADGAGVVAVAAAPQSQPSVSPATSSPVGGRSATTVAEPPKGVSERLSRIRAGKMPAITQPVMFDTAKADAIVSALEVYPPDNPWNQVVADWPAHPNSAKIVASIGVDKPLRCNTDMAFILVPADQKRVPVAIVDYPDESDRGPYPVPEGAPIEGWPVEFRRDPKLVSATLDDVQRDRLKLGGDRHCSVVDPVNRMLYEFYRMRKTDKGWQAAQASVFDLKTNALRPDGWTSTDAAGLPIFPAVVRYDELQRGMVEHAMRVTVHKTRRAYVAPATHFASRLQDEQYPRMGERLRLKRDYDISEFSPPVQAILNGLKQYGMLVADNGIDWAISVTPDARIPNLHEELRRVKGSAFEVVVPPR